jgi:hypothetical protein
MVFNTDYENEAGEHWVAVYINRQTKTGFCFDSMPLWPYPSEIRSNLCKICDRKLMVNRNGFVVHHPDYPLCGLYCLRFLEHYSKDFDFNLKPDNLLHKDIRVVTRMMPLVCKTLNLCVNFTHKLRILHCKEIIENSLQWFKLLFIFNTERENTSYTCNST